MGRYISLYLRKYLIQVKDVFGTQLLQVEAQRLVTRADLTCESLLFTWFLIIIEVKKDLHNPALPHRPTVISYAGAASVSWTEWTPWRWRSRKQRRRLSISTRKQCQRMEGEQEEENLPQRQSLIMCSQRLVQA